MSEKKILFLHSTGTCLFAEKTGLIIPNDYEDMKEIVYFSSIEELVEKFLYLIENKEKIIEIAKNGYEKTKEFHTSDKRAEYIIKKMNLEL